MGYIVLALLYGRHYTDIFVWTTLHWHLWTTLLLMIHKYTLVVVMKSLKRIQYFYITIVYFNGISHQFKFRVAKNTTFIDLKSILDNLLNQNDNWRMVKINYGSPTIDIDKKIRSNKLELKTKKDVRAMWNIFHRYKLRNLSRWMWKFQNQETIFWKW